MTGRLNGKRVLITGTAGGQGEAAQALFAREGARVVGCDLHEGAAEATAETLVKEGHDVFGATVDLTDEQQARRWVDDAVERLGGIDVLYNNAAGFAFAPFSELTFEQWQYVMRVEVDLVFHVTSAAWPHLLDGGGSLINTSSLSAKRGVGAIGQAAHSAAKGAVTALTRTLAAEGAEHGVRANSISPGFVASPATEKAFEDEAAVNYILQMQLIQRPGTGEDIAALALYLASDESSFVTGQDISIDGGWTAGYR